jgi:SAM-dependent methyltransferase
MQIQSVGSAYEATLAEAARFYSFVRQTCVTSGKPIHSRTKILDFGVGWGRIIRFFLKETDAKCLYGVDVSELYLEAARQSGCQCNLQKIEALGSMSCYPDATFDLVYAYSVFTHLPEAVQDRWLSEIRRVLRPGGMFVATVEPPRLLEHRMGLNPNDESLHPRERRLAAIVAAEPEIHAGLIARGFTHIPMVATYGDTMMTDDYLRRHWGTFFEVIDFVDDATRSWQAVASLRRPASHR